LEQDELPDTVQKYVPNKFLLPGGSLNRRVSRNAKAAAIKSRKKVEKELSQNPGAVRVRGIRERQKIETSTKTAKHIKSLELPPEKVLKQVSEKLEID
jgi:hypothetical protein